MTNPKDKVFNTDHLKNGMKDRAVKSVGITLGAQGVKLTLHIASIAILARLLQPSDFGLIAMVTIFTGLALQFMDGGLSIATIQRDHITHAQVSNLFWINGALGTGLCLLGVLISPLVAAIYDEPRITLVMAALSLTFLIGGLSVQHDALLRRQMRFKAISMIDVISMATGTAIGIIAAFGGLGYWALVISSITIFATKTVMRWLSVQWVPSLMNSTSGMRPLLGFGMNLTGANFIGYFATHVTPFAIGYISGAQTLGLYNRANMLTTLTTTQLLPPVMNVLQPALIRMQNDTERLRRVALSLMTKIAIVTMLVTIVMFVTADWLVLIVLGDDWTEAVTVFRILALGTIVTPITTFTATIMVAVGEAKALMRWKAITLTILAISISIGSLWGFLGVVLAHCLSGLFLRMPGFLIYSTKYQPIRAKEYFKSLSPVFFCACLTLVVAMQLRDIFLFGNAPMSILAFSIITTLIYLCLLFFWKNTRREIRESLILMKEFSLTTDRLMR